MYLEMWELDKGILELFGGYFSLFKKDMYIGECLRYFVQWKKLGRKSKGDGIYCFGIFVCLYFVGLYECMYLYG